MTSRWTITGTHRGTFQGVPATGRRVAFSGIDFSRVVDGKIAEHWAQFDLLAVLQQIGAIPGSARVKEVAVEPAYRVSNDIYACEPSTPD